MNLKHLTDETLVENTKPLGHEERRLLTEVLYHLREIDQRRLYSKYKHDSLGKMVMVMFGYSEGQAYQRIAAMRLLVALPEIEPKIQSGELNITHLALAQTHFSQEKKARNQEVSIEEKAAFVEEIAGQSINETKRTVLANSSTPNKLKPDRIAPVSEEFVEFKFSGPRRLVAKIENLKGLLAHQHPQISQAGLYEKLCDLGLQEWDPSKPSSRQKRRTREKSESPRDVSAERKPDDLVKAQTKATFDLSRDQSEHEQKMSGPEAKSEIKKRKSRTSEKRCVTTKPATSKDRITEKVRREVWARANNQCEHCKSIHALQVDHIIPRSHGGSSKLENLRLLCRPCNQRAAIEKLGRRKMEAYLSR